jgi:glucuronoarabinoxylan endo-1,4-beta-xylanase
VITLRKFGSRAIWVAAAGWLLAACEPKSGPQTDSQTNWLRACSSQSDCGDLDCICGACTRLCDRDAACKALGDTSCLTAQEVGVVALCSGTSPSVAGLCLPACRDGSCPEGQMCVAGACNPVPKPAVHVVVDGDVENQTLVGIGATLAYVEADVLKHPRSAELVDAMFSGLGLDILRLRNRYGYTGDDDLGVTRDIVDAATESLGRTPTLILQSWSPPSTSKANGSTVCQGDLDTCTLAKTEDGSFDYAGYADYWRASVEAYAAVGVVPDFIGLQNNPDFVPTVVTPGEGCRFLPREGTATVVVGGTQVRVDYPGYAEALAAVADRLTSLSPSPKLIAPDVSVAASLSGYVAELDLARVAALSHHLYWTDPSTVDVDAFQALGNVGKNNDLPLFQTEMESDGIGTAVLMHYSLAVEGAAAYLLGVLVRPVSSSPVALGTLIATDTSGFTLDDAYHAVRHYALYTDPGWIRVGAASDTAELLASGWASPARDALTLVLVNPTTSDLDVELDLGDYGSMTSEVTRTVFSGVERSADLGALSAPGILRVPGQAIVTVALKE